MSEGIEVRVEDVIDAFASEMGKMQTALIMARLRANELEQRLNAVVATLPEHTVEVDE